jgi:hypothetical protein
LLQCGARRFESRRLAALTDQLIKGRHESLPLSSSQNKLRSPAAIGPAQAYARRHDNSQLSYVSVCRNLAFCPGGLSAD